MKVANIRELAICHWEEDLQINKYREHNRKRRKREYGSLANVVYIPCPFTFAKENGHALRHVDPQEPIGVSNQSCERSKNDCFSHSVFRQVFLPKSSHLDVELDHQCTIQTLNNRLRICIGKREKSVRTPKTPRIMKNMISKKCQSRSYVTWNMTSFPVRKGFIADKVTVAMSAQKKLRHIVLMLKVWLISCVDMRLCKQNRHGEPTSMENKTPPIGEPNATATPAALEAVTISRIFPRQARG